MSNETGTSSSQSSPATSLGYMRRSPAGVLLTILTILCALIWFFPIYWAVITSLRADSATVEEFTLFPSEPTLSGYIFGIVNSELPIWYLNSTITSVISHRRRGVHVGLHRLCHLATALSGRMLLWWMILASFMVPVTALIVNHFIIMADVGLLNSHLGIVLPMLLHPVTVIVYKQFFDGLRRNSARRR